MSWINENGPIKDVVLSSRTRLARNVARYPFPAAMQEKQAKEIAEKVRKSIQDGKSRLNTDFAFLYMKDVPVIERQILVEKHLASQDLMQNYEVSAMALDSAEKVTVMVNEEDHIRMQCILPGFQLNKAWEILDRVDDVVESEVDYAFDKNFGYLTSCPTNVGTGLRSSVMMHLPALTANNQMNAILQTISKIGLTARGIYGEGTEALGNMYQISNQITLGPSEEDIINNLTIACRQIIEKERMARKAFLKVSGIQFEDALWRSFGILCNARVLELKEFMALISQVRLGISMGILPNMEVEALDSLMTAGQPAGIVKRAGRRLDELEINITRADVIRETMEGIINSKNIS
jgi:protein arginine kinase